MKELLQYLFGPLEKKYYCSFFLVLTIFGFVFMVGAIMLLLYNIKEKTTMAGFINSITVVIFYAVFYLQARILYSVCLGTLDK
jgi:hypothetical protein